jgi:hypothetical protein
VADDLVERQFRAPEPNVLWVAALDVSMGELGSMVDTER